MLIADLVVLLDHEHIDASSFLQEHLSFLRIRRIRLVIESDPGAAAVVLTRNYENRRNETGPKILSSKF